MADTKRVIIGSEINDDRHLELNKNSGQVTIPVTIFDSAGNQTTVQGGLVGAPFDYIVRVLTNSTTETYTYKTGGSTGTTVATVTVVYTDSSLGTVSTVTKT